MPYRFFHAFTRPPLSFDTRVRVAVVALVAVSIMLTTLRHFAGTLQLVREPFVDEVTLYEDRLRPLKAVLPPRAVVGMITDAPDPRELEKRHHIFEYVLTPFLVAADADWALVIGDFRDAATETPSRDADLRVLQDFGNGVILFERER